MLWYVSSVCSHDFGRFKEIFHTITFCNFVNIILHDSLCSAAQDLHNVHTAMRGDIIQLLLPVASASRSISYVPLLLHYSKKSFFPLIKIISARLIVPSIHPVTWFSYYGCWSYSKSRPSRLPCVAHVSREKRASSWWGRKWPILGKCATTGGLAACNLEGRYIRLGMPGIQGDRCPGSSKACNLHQGLG